MTIDEYIAALRQAIRTLPPEEAGQAIAYYDEYLHDAADPAAAMMQLGSPKEVAASILADYVGKAGAKTKLNMVWAIVLGILAAPVAAPLAIAAFAIVLALLAALLAVILSLAATGVSLCLGGLGMAITGLLVVAQHLPTSLSLLGGGLLLAAIGLLWTYGIYRLGRSSISGFAQFAARFTRRAS